MKGRTECEEFCRNEYKRIFDDEVRKSKLKKADDVRRYAQKKAIKDASINAIRMYPQIEPSEIWKTIYVAHIHNTSGITDVTVIDGVISADNSWKKSSGHAFEEMIRDIGNLNLSKHNIIILLQKELSEVIKKKSLTNEVRDISWLNEQIKSSTFDLYLTMLENGKYTVYGCLQSKTSIRDRVTRDREPSINAMKAYFVSFAVVMDGDFLRLPKFQHMVNGNSTEYAVNGWHYMYVFTQQSIENDRIKSIDINMEKFTFDCVKGSEFWTNKRQWLDHTWRSESV